MFLTDRVKSEDEKPTNAVGAQIKLRAENITSTIVDRGSSLYLYYLSELKENNIYWLWKIFGIEIDDSRVYKIDTSYFDDKIVLFTNGFIDESIALQIGALGTIVEGKELIVILWARVNVEKQSNELGVPVCSDFLMIKGGKLISVTTDKPIYIDWIFNVDGETFFSHPNIDSSYSIWSTALAETTSSKVVSKQFFRKFGLLSPQGITIQGNDQNNLRQEIESFLKLHNDDEIVIKSELWMGWEFVRIVRAVNIDEIVKIVQEFSKNGRVLIERRIIPPAVYDQTRQKLDYNFRIIVSYSPVAHFVLCVARVGIQSSNPVNISTGATARLTGSIIFHEAQWALELAIKKSIHFSQSLFKELKEDPHTSGWLGFDVMIDWDWSPTFLEVNSWMVGCLYDQMKISRTIPEWLRHLLQQWWRSLHKKFLTRMDWKQIVLKTDRQIVADILLDDYAKTLSKHHRAHMKEKMITATIKQIISEDSYQWIPSILKWLLVFCAYTGQFELADSLIESINLSQQHSDQLDDVWWTIMDFYAQHDIKKGLSYFQRQATLWSISLLRIE